MTVRRLAAGVAVVLMAWAAVSGILPPAVAGAPVERASAAHDYLRTAGLSAPVHTTRRDTFEVAMHDSVRLHVEVVRPTTPGRWPVVLEASPYHGTLADRDGKRILPGPVDPTTGEAVGLTGYFGPRGYAVVMVDLRGTGRSEGCLDQLGPQDARDLKEIVEWAADQPWSTGRVGMTGHSYVAATTVVAAAQRPRGLVTIVPSAGLASMYHHQFQGGVPYNLQWAGTMFSYVELSIGRSLPATGVRNPILGGNIGYGDNVGRDPARTGCGAASTSLLAGESQLSGAYSPWHRVRDHTAGATAAPIPVFLVHGVNDDAARIAAIDWFDRRARPGDKAWIGQWSHGFGCCPNRRGAQWTAALHAWFDHHLKQLRVDTGPRVEIFLADGTFHAARTGARTEVLRADTWPPPSRRLVLHAMPDGQLSETAPRNPTSVSFSSLFAATSSVTFTSEPLTRDLYLAGVPTMSLVASITTPRLHLIATVYDQAPKGDLRRITQFAINPELRGGLDRPAPVTPGQTYVMRPPGFPMAHHLRPGHRITLRIATTDPDKVATFSVDPRVTVTLGGGGTNVQLPVIDRVRVARDDVPL